MPPQLSKLWEGIVRLGIHQVWRFWWEIFRRLSTYDLELHSMSQRWQGYLWPHHPLLLQHNTPQILPLHRVDIQAGLLCCWGIRNCHLVPCLPQHIRRVKGPCRQGQVRLGITILWCSQCSVWLGLRQNASTKLLAFIRPLVLLPLPSCHLINSSLEPLIMHPTPKRHPLTSFGGGSKSRLASSVVEFWSSPLSTSSLSRCTFIFISIVDAAAVALAALVRPALAMCFLHQWMFHRGGSSDHYLCQQKMCLVHQDEKQKRHAW